MPKTDDRYTSSNFNPYVIFKDFKASMNNKNILFIDKANMVHGGIYDYSQVVYKNSCSKVKIKCPIHGFFIKPLQTT